MSYRFFFMKRKLKELFISKVLFIYIIQFLAILLSIILFIFLEYYYYLKIVLVSAINSLGFFTLFILWMVSYGNETIDYFDDQVFIIKNSIMNFVAALSLLALTTLYYYTFLYSNFSTILISTIVLNIILLILLKRKLVNLIIKQMIKNSKKLN
ncbi:hypothetical protein A8C32_14560 [Flavivirga aquatica]|uniref:Uncharacterized protein n=2 Tax=Flavivirga aquatica TaxID=1849968 RepID=A0A1E5TCJ0_9FLAO|nr:hypothetical protein A8C32_14560 [Flavivirga aquatica]